MIKKGAKKNTKKLLIIVATLSLCLHAIAVYMLCELSFAGGFLALSKNPLSLPFNALMRSEIAEVALNPQEPKEHTYTLEEERGASDWNAFLSVSTEQLTEPTQLAPSLIRPELNQLLFATVEEQAPFDLLGSSEQMPSDEGSPHDLCYEGDERIVSDDFSYQIEYAPRRLRTGYVFKISLFPKPDVLFQRMRQNFFFLIDRSNSIPRARYFLNKKAIANILPTLAKEDRFNILVFDDKVVKLATESLECTPENIARGQEFLETLGHGGYFATTDIYASLGRILPGLVSDREINTAILLSDGDTYLSMENQRLLIRNWSEANNGKVTLFCCASGSGNNATLLEMIAAFNKGAFLYVSDHNQIEEKLCQLVLSLRHPIGKEISLSTLALTKEAKPTLMPKMGRLPDLYQHRPFVIYGVTQRLEDFTLFLQGKFYDRKFDLRKKISFAQGRSGTLDLERKYTALLTQDYYEQYFKDGKVAHLEASRQLLAPLNMAVPFLK